MTVCVEPYGSRTGKGGRAHERARLYRILGTADIDEAEAALAAGSPATLGTLVRDTYTVKESHVDENTPADCIWDGEVNYVAASTLAAKQPLPVGGKLRSFSISGETQHITKSFATVHSYAPTGKTAPNMKQAIGVTKDGVDGCDISVSAYNFEERVTIAGGDVNDVYKRILAQAANTVNDAAFKGFAKGEVRYLGCDANEREDGNWEFVHRFSAKPNQAGKTIGDITGVAYEGWHYVWILFEPAEDDTAKKLAFVPAAVYVERVYDYSPFNLIGIGTT